jgi:hypothetical protein
MYASSVRGLKCRRRIASRARWPSGLGRVSDGPAGTGGLASVCRESSSFTFTPIGPAKALARPGSADGERPLPANEPNDCGTGAGSRNAPAHPCLPEACPHRSLARNREPLTRRPTFLKTTRRLPRRQHFTSRARTFCSRDAGCPSLWPRHAWRTAFAGPTRTRCACAHAAPRTAPCTCFGPTQLPRHRRVLDVTSETIPFRTKGAGTTIASPLTFFSCRFAAQAASVR